MLNKLPYERVVAFIAGPIAIAAGYAATWAVVHLGILSHLGFGHDRIAAAIVIAATFVVSAIVTYLGHAKWMSNLTKWWAVNVPSSGVASLPVPLDSPPPAKVFAEIDVVNAKIAALTESAPPAPTDVSHGLAPDPSTTA